MLAFPKTLKKRIMGLDQLSQKQKLPELSPQSRSLEDLFLEWAKGE